MASDTNQLRDMFADWALNFAAQVLTLVTMLGVMFWLNWRLAAVVSATLLPLMAAWAAWRVPMRIASASLPAQAPAARHGVLT